MFNINPVVKLLCLIIYITLILVVNKLEWFIYCYLLVLSISIFKSNALLTIIKVSIFSFIISCLNLIYINIFFGSGDVLFTIVGFNIYQNSFNIFINYFFKIISIISFTLYIVKSLSNEQFIYAFSKIFYFLNFVKVDVNRLTMIFSLTLRFIPILHLEFKRNINAQKVRGFFIKNSNKFKQIMSLSNVIVPVLFSSFKRADTLATAMDIKFYSTNKKRTSFEEYELNFVNYIYIIVLVAMFIFTIRRVYE